MNKYLKLISIVILVLFFPAGFSQSQTEQTVYYAEGFHGGIYCLATMDDVYNMLNKMLDAMDEHDDYKVNLELEGLNWEKLAGEFRGRFGNILGRLKYYIDQGRVEITTSYTQPFFAYIDGETIIRQMLSTQKVVDNIFGSKMVTYATQEPLFTTQLPQILAGTGIKYTVLRAYWPLFGDATPIYKQKIWWVGPDGTRIQTIPAYPDYKRIKNPLGYALIDFEPKKVYPQLKKIPDIAQKYRYTTFREYFEKTPQPTQKVSYTPENLMISSHPVTLDHIEAVLPFPWGIVGGKIQQYCRKGKNVILATERLAAILALSQGFEYPGSDLDKAWEKLFMAQHHDVWVCPMWNISPKAYAAGVLSENTAEWTDQIKEICGHLTKDLLAKLSSKISTLPDFNIQSHSLVIPVVVFNTLAEQLSEIATVTADFPETSVRKLKVVDAQGRETPCQIVEKTCRKNATLKKARVIFLAENLPSMGYKVFYLVSGAPSFKELPVRSGDDWVEAENEFYKLRFNLRRGGGLERLYDKQLAEEFINPSAGLANTFIARIPELKKFVNSGDKPAKLSLIETGPLRAHIAMQGKLHQWPYRVDVYLYRGVKRVEFEVTFDFPPETSVGARDFKLPDDLTDKQGVYRGDCYDYGGWWKTPLSKDLDWRFNEEKLRVSLPLAIEDAVIYRDAPFEVAPADRQAFTALTWVDYSNGKKGLTILADRTAAYLKKDGKLSMVLAYGGAFTYGPGKNMFLKGPCSYRYALTTHAGNWAKARTPHTAARYNYKPVTQTAQLKEAALPGQTSFLSLKPCDPLVAAIYADQAKSYLRLLDVYGNNKKTTLTLKADMSRAYLTALDGTPLANTNVGMDINGSSVTVDMKQFSLTTIATPSRPAAKSQPLLQPVKPIKPKLQQ